MQQILIRLIGDCGSFNCQFPKYPGMTKHGIFHTTLHSWWWIATLSRWLLELYMLCYNQM